MARGDYAERESCGRFPCVGAPPVPRCSDWASSSLISPSRVSLPRSCSRVGLHIDLFGACSAFTRVAARTLAPSAIRDQLHRRLQPFRHLHDCSGCFRLERSPGGTCTPGKHRLLTAHANTGHSAAARRMDQVDTQRTSFDYGVSALQRFARQRGRFSRSLRPEIPRRSSE